MSETKSVVFPAGYREGQSVHTRGGTVTIGTHRRADLSPAQHADLLARKGAEYFAHVDQEPTCAELEADRVAARDAAVRNAGLRAKPGSDEYERVASAAEAKNRAIAKAGDELERHVAAAALDSAQKSPDGDAEVDLGSGIKGGGRSAKLHKAAQRAAAAARFTQPEVSNAAATVQDPAEAGQ